ncbi:MAG: FAD-dependent oxidoreductase [candidate division FCPU426 bacterium]
MAEMSETKILLVGAGHAHLEVLARSRSLRACGGRIILLDRNPHWFFPNFAAGVLGGEYGLKDFQVDLKELCRRQGADFVQDEAVSLLPQQKKLLTRSGRVLDFDLIALAVGSISQELERDVPAEGSFPVFPVYKVLEIRNEIETFLELFPQRRLELAVVGAGPSGVEYAVNAAQLMAERAPSEGWKLTLVERRDRVLPNLAPAAGRLAFRALIAHDVVVRTGAAVQHIQSNRLVLERGETVPFDLAVVATGGRCDDWLGKSGLPSDEYGALAVDRTLEVNRHPGVFATGDCATVSGTRSLRSGSLARAQGPVLAANLLASLRRQGKRRFQGPYRGCQLVSLGKSEALLALPHAALAGRWAARLKRWLDGRYRARWPVAP